MTPCWASPNVNTLLSLCFVRFIASLLHISSSVCDPGWREASPGTCYPPGKEGESHSGNMRWQCLHRDNMCNFCSQPIDRSLTINATQKLSPLGDMATIPWRPRTSLILSTCRTARTSPLSYFWDVHLPSSPILKRFLEANPLSPVSEETGESGDNFFRRPSASLWICLQ